MATTAVNVSVDPTHTYTVPANKRLVAACHPNVSGGGQVVINGVTIGICTAGATINSIKPVEANAGDVFSCVGTSYGLSGTLFDV